MRFSSFYLVETPLLDPQKKYIEGLSLLHTELIQTSNIFLRFQLSYPLKMYHKQKNLLICLKWWVCISLTTMCPLLLVISTWVWPEPSLTMWKEHMYSWGSTLQTWIDRAGGSFFRCTSVLHTCYLSAFLGFFRLIHVKFLPLSSHFYYYTHLLHPLLLFKILFFAFLNLNCCHLSLKNLFP